MIRRNQSFGFLQKLVFACVLSAGTALSAFAGVTITAPAPNSTNGTSVTFSGSATPASSNPITAMRIYLDNVAVYTVGANKLNTTLNVANGNHYLVMQAWDSSGAAYQASENFSVGASGGAITISQPANGATVSSPVPFGAQATAPSGRTITAMRLYVDNASLYTVAANNLSTSLNIGGGNHHLVIQAWDQTGAVYQTSENFTVGTSGTSSGGVAISQPANGATVSAPVQFSATASAPSGRTITAMRLYVDNNSMDTVNANSISANVPLNAGAHNAVVQAWDETGAVYKTPVSFTVSSAATSALRITSTGLSTATTNTAYSATLTATGGSPGYTWSMASGQLPPGLSLSSNGVISGTTTVAGTFPISVRVGDANLQSATASFNLISANASSNGYTRFYSPTSFWNTPIPANPAIDPNSAAIVNKSLVPFVASATFSNWDAWGVPLAYANGNSKTYNVTCTIYCTGDTINFPIPAGAQVATGTDHHLAVVNGNQELDMWEASYDAATDTWSAGVRVVNDLYGWGAYCPQGQHCNGANAAGFALLGGHVRPEEIAQGHIDHALAIITPATRAGYIACPATHTDGPVNDPAAIPEGARIQLDPTFNVDAQSWPAWEKILAKALQTYGAYVVDTGGALAVRAVTDQNLGSTSWASVNTPKGALINDIPWDRMRVMQIQSCN